jgi:hypothetical protein
VVRYYYKYNEHTFPIRVSVCQNGGFCWRGERERTLLDDWLLDSYWPNYCPSLLKTVSTGMVYSDWLAVWPLLLKSVSPHLRNSELMKSRNYSAGGVGAFALGVCCLRFVYSFPGLILVFRTRLNGEKFPGRLVQSVVFWESGNVTRCMNSGRCRHFLILVACFSAVTELSFVEIYFLWIVCFFVIPVVYFSCVCVWGAIVVVPNFR